MVTFGRDIGRCTPPVIQELRTETTKGHFNWRRLDIDSLELSHVSGLLVLQGLPLKKLFEGVRFSSVDVISRTYIFLRGELTSALDPPPRLRRAVLADVAELPPDLEETEMLGILLSEVL